MHSEFKKTLKACLDYIAKDVEILVDAKLTFERRNAVYGRDKALEQLKGHSLQFATTTRMDEAESKAGFAIPEAVAIDMGATLLMMQGEVDEFTEEIAEGFDEVLNVLIGSWKTAAPRPSDRLNNAVESRGRHSYSVDDLYEYLDENELELLVVPITFNNTSYPFGIVGSKVWFEGERTGPLSSEDSSDGFGGGRALGSDDDGAAGFGGGQALNLQDGSSSSGGGGGASSAPSPANASRPSAAGDGASRTLEVPDGPDARMMLVDLSGALNEWLTEHLRNGTLKFVRPSTDLSELDERATLVVVGPNPALFRQLQVPQRVVSKALESADGDAASAA